MKKKSNEIMIHKGSESEDFEKVTFVMKALYPLLSDDFRSVIHSEKARKGSRLVATDGKRLHVAIVKSDIPSGNYRAVVKGYAVCLERVEKEIRYPSWKNIVPENARLKAEIDLSETYRGMPIAGAEKLSVAYSTIMGKTGRAINIHFLSDLPERRWNVYAEKNHTAPIVFKDKADENSAYAVFAPLAA